MPLGDFEREVLRLLAANRNPDSFIAGATVLHRSDDSPRRSEDVDVFHDLPEALVAACDADTATLCRQDSRSNRSAACSRISAGR